jgi:urease accessory protein
MLPTALLVVAGPAAAHHPMGGVTPSTPFEGLLSGLGHPVIGLDHLAFLVVAALLAALLQGPGRYLVPLAFVGATAAGTLAQVSGMGLPAVELLVAASVLIGGALVLGRARLGAPVLAGLLAFAGLFHGYAYGESIVGAESAPLMAYLAGFSLIQYALICMGVFALSTLSQRSLATASRVTRAGGLATAAAGGLLLVAGLV